MDYLKTGIKICVYGMGSIGKSIGYKVIEACRIKVDYICDTNYAKALSNNSFSATVIKKEELIDISENVLVIEFTSMRIYYEIKNELSVNPNLVIINYNEFVNCTPDSGQ